jgi:hypothetical protein
MAGLWLRAAEAVLSVFNDLILPSLADTSGLSRGAIAAEPLLYPAPSCASTPQGTECSFEYMILLQLFDDHNSSIHGIVREQQPLLSADPHTYRGWVKAASVAAGVVQLLYQASISNLFFRASLDNQQSRYEQLMDRIVLLATPQT